MFKLVWPALLIALTGTASAEIVAGPVTSDLNRDGVAERFVLDDTGDGSADLIIERTGRGTIVADDIAWIGGIGQKPALAVAANGSVQVISMNEAIGRNRWRLTLTIAWRDGAYRVAGATYGYYDTLDLNRSGGCDLNLLSGRGILTASNGTQSVMAVPLAALSVTDWTDATPLPRACYGP